MRFFEGGLNHGEFDGPHNDAAQSVSECDACIAYARRILAIRETEGIDAARRAHTDMRIDAIEGDFGGGA